LEEQENSLQNEISIYESCVLIGVDTRKENKVSCK
jgi:hypothetical protein